MPEPDPFLPSLDPASPKAAEAASTARELVTAYLARHDDPRLLSVVLPATLQELYEGLDPSPAQTRRAAELLCAMAALLQVALSGVGELAADEGAEEIDVATIFEQLAASAVDDGLTY
ncbi:MAG TPA: hypothetical protein VGR26_03450 [Acidimicrobiales bacterium]|nr:hypothetical protein [Acidimicrobiales bacterium]